MNKALPLEQLKSMSRERREHRLGKLVAVARGPANGEVRLVDAKIHKFEEQYRCASSLIREKVASGEIKETAGVCEWLMLLDLQARLANSAR